MIIMVPLNSGHSMLHVDLHVQRLENSLWGNLECSNVTGKCYLTFLLSLKYGQRDVLFRCSLCCNTNNWGFSSLSEFGESLPINPNYIFAIDILRDLRKNGLGSL